MMFNPSKNNTNSGSVQLKVSSYIVRYPVLGTDHTLHFTLWQTCSFQCLLYFSGKYTAMLHLLSKDYSFISTTLQPGTHLLKFQNGSKMIQNQVLPIESSVLTSEPLCPRVTVATQPCLDHLSTTQTLV